VKHLASRAAENRGTEGTTLRAHRRWWIGLLIWRAGMGTVTRSPCLVKSIRYILPRVTVPVGIQQGVHDSKTLKAIEIAVGGP